MTLHVPRHPLGRALVLARCERPLYVGLRVQPARGAKALGVMVAIAIASLLGALSSGCNESQFIYNYCPTPTPQATP